MTDYQSFIIKRESGMARPVDPHKSIEILKVARKKFFEKGYNQTVMSQIAQEAGIANGTLYLYYPTKEALALALSEDFYSRLTVVVLPALQEAKSLNDIMQVVQASLRFIEQERDLVGMLNVYARKTQAPGPMPARREFYQKLSEIFEARMADGIIRRYDPAVAAELVAGLIEWVAEATMVRGFGDLEHYEQTLLAFVRQGLLPDS